MNGHPVTPMRRVFSRCLRLVEKKELEAAYEPESPQLFITGLPRSGTTLVSQYAVHRFAFAYFTRAAGDFPWAACTVTRWQRFWNPRYVSDFSSRIGKSRGPVAPREAGAFWGRHFGYNEYIGPDAITAAARETVERTVWRVQNHAADAPFINKNVKHLLRLEGLLSIFPNASILIVERDLAEIALSLLDVRRELGNDLTRWFSVRPPSFPDIEKLAPLEQIARQVIDLTFKMDQDLLKLPSSRVMRLSYREFCQNPERLGDIIRRFYPRIAHANEARQNFDIRIRTASDPDEQLLFERVRELEAAQVMRRPRISPTDSSRNNTSEN